MGGRDLWASGGPCATVQRAHPRTFKRKPGHLRAMVKWVPTFVMVLAIMSPLPLFMTPTPAEVDVNLDWVGWEAPLLSRGSPGDVIYVVDISDVPDGERITYKSLQGLVNRKAGEIYLIHNEKDLFWLEKLRSTYNVTTRWLAPGAFIERYRDVPRGLVVIDPAKEATVNLATTIAGVERFLIVHPSRVDRFREILGKDLWVLDLRDPPWGDLEGMHLYRKAFEAYFARCSQRFIAFLPPDVHYARDLAVSQAAFTLYQVPGPFSNPLEWEGLKTVLRDTPYTHAILGSIEPYIGAEEDFAIREFSIHGKYFVPVARVPNLSILSTFEPTRDLDVGRSAPDVSVEPRHYVCIGVEDGDNLAFLQDRMVDLWLRPDRETVPMAWTLPPYARDLAPLFVDYYLSSTPGYDTFFMAPSGSGLAFPDFMPDGARDRLMDLTREHALEMNASFAWVLNSYRTYEVRYTEDLLERYVDIGLRGLVLDYDDMPWHEQYRIVGARERHAPVIRSTQLWRDIDNLRAKLEVHRDAYDERPLFTFLAYNPWSGDLDDLVDLLDDLGCEVVDIATFFALMERASIGDARRTVDTLRSIPTSALVPMFADGADDLLDDATANGTSNAYLAWRARQRAEAGIGVALAVLVLVMAGAAAVLL
ncbi:MAG TPA: hypothetical protein EYP43_02870, partial [Thermoplasmata archaeon]|nr:hypothetical protein [Thermoplasmata archaeon]